LYFLGPYICGEWENGGLPWWLLNKNISSMRTSDKRFKNAVQTWFSVLLPLIKPLLRKNNGPVLMVQIENEYGSYKECDRNYTAWLRNLTRKFLGKDAVVYTNMYSLGASMNFYMIHGGTNFGFWSGAESNAPVCFLDSE
uniref:Glyco_hydro_35 domain-containing protein n=1 Tax=Angiostrongylus cantonensis TaxID=6313 RepID=A0A0K0CVY0_ANGCA